MKKLVKKIALPGAIIAFVMVLFGGAAYAGDKLKSWETSGALHFNETSESIAKLVTYIQTLKAKQLENEGALKKLSDEKNVFEGKLGVLSEEKAKAAEQLKSRSNEITRLQGINKDQASKIQELDRQKDKRRDAVYGFVSEKKILTSQIESLKAKITSLENTLDDEKNGRKTDQDRVIGHADELREKVTQAVVDTGVADTK